MVLFLTLAALAFALCLPAQAHASEPGSYDIGNGNVTCDSTSGMYVISGSTTGNYVTVSGGSATSPIHIALDNVNINLRHSDNDKSTERSAIQIDSGSWVTIDVAGSNYLQGGNDTGWGDNDGYAGIGVHAGANLTLTGDGSLEAHGGGNDTLQQGAAGIGGDSNGASHGDRNVGAITIIGDVTVTAYGAYHAAGIGGGDDGSEANGIITIMRTPHVTATGGDGAAGIGSGDDGNGGSVYIDMDAAGTVVAQGGKNAAGIGVGDDDQDFSIHIGGAGSITATGGAESGTGGGDGAGIGTGRSKITAIAIAGDTGSRDLSIKAVAGGDAAAGIGMGGSKVVDLGSSTMDSILVANATVSVTPGRFGAGIGGGNCTTVKKISVSNCSVAVTYDEHHYGAGLGAGASGTVNAIYLVNSDYEGDTIGSSSVDERVIGNPGDMDLIHIEGCGRVVAHGHDYYDSHDPSQMPTPVAGIGPGEGANIGAIEIIGCDYVEGTGVNGGAGIGTSGYSYCSDTEGNLFSNNGGHGNSLVIRNCTTVVGTGSAGTDTTVVTPAAEKGGSGEKVFYAGFAGAGIGAGTCGKIDSVAISGCTTVTAQGGSNKGEGRGASGIGGAGFASCGDISIADCGSVTATGGYSAAGVGSGGVDASLLTHCESADNIWILVETAEVGTGTITLSNSAVTATGGDRGAGVGCGARSDMDGAFIFENCTLTAQGGYCAAGIGTSCNENCVKGILFKGTGNIHATGGNGGAGIGSGNEGTVDGLSFEMDTVVADSGSTFAERCAASSITATGGDGAAGIGSGYVSGTASRMQILSGYVHAQGGSGGNGAGAGIGSGAAKGSGHEDLENLTISGGIVEAYGGSDSADDIGCGQGNTSKASGNYRVTGGTIVADRWQETPTIDGGSVTAVFTDAKSSSKQSVTQRIIALSAPFAKAAAETVLPSGYGATGMYADGSSKIYPYLPASYHSDTTIAFAENPSKVYDGTAVSDPSVATTSDGAITYTYYSDAACTKAISAPTDAGTYWVKAQVAATNSYAAVTSDAMEFTIAPHNLELTLSAAQSGTDATITCTASGFVGSEHPGSITFTVGGQTQTVTIDTDGTASYAFTGVAAQDYQVTAAYADDTKANYKADDVTQAFAKDAQMRTIAGTTTHEVAYGTAPFSLGMGTNVTSDGDAWSYEVVSDSIHDLDSAFAATASVDNAGTVTVANAGTVQIRVTLSDTKNRYNPTSTIVTVNVTRQAMIVTPYAYTTDPATLFTDHATYGNLGSMHYGIHYAYGSTTDATEPPAGAFLGTLTASLPETADAGAANIVIRKQGAATFTYNGHTYSNVFFSRNYDITYAAGTLVIDPAQLTVTAADATGIYGEAEPAYDFTVTGMAAWDTLSTAVGAQAKAGLKTGLTWGSSLVPGTYSDAVVVQNCTPSSNYVLAAGSPVAGNLTVNKGTVTLSVSAPSITYDGKSYEENNKLTYDKPDASATYTVSYEAVSISNGIETTTPLSASPTNAGAYKVTVAMTNSGRYEDTTASGYFAIFKVGGSVTIAGYDPSKTYDGTAATPLAASQVKAAYSDGATVNVQYVWQQQASDGTWEVVGSGIAYAPTNAGTYRVWVCVPGTANYRTLYTYQTATIDPLTLAWLSGTTSTYTIGTDTSAELHCNGVLGDLASVSVDGATVAQADYDKAQGSTIVTLHQGYLDALPNGDHTMTLTYDDTDTDNYVNDQISTTLAVTGQAEGGGIEPASNNPVTRLASTGDSHVLWSILLALVVSGAVVLVARRSMKKRVER